MGHIEMPGKMVSPEKKGHYFGTDGVASNIPFF
jgi:hypothetical protein